MLEIGTPSLAIDRNSPVEKVSYSQDFVGLQVRLLLGDKALNPDHQLTFSAEELTDKIKDFKTRSDKTYSLLEKASRGERAFYWKKRTEQEDIDLFDKQKEIWRKEIVSSYNDRSNEESKATFSKLNLGKGEQKINLENFTDTEATKLYERYFTSSEDNKDLKPIALFIRDTAENYIEIQTGHNGDQALKIDYEKLKADLPAIQWFSHIFGEEYSPELIAQLIDAECQAQNHTLRDSLAQNAVKVETKDNQPVSRVNNLLASETALLRFLGADNRPDLSHLQAPVVDKSEDETRSKDIEDSKDDDRSKDKSSERPPKKEEPVLVPPTYSSEFTRSTEECLKRCGIKTEYINPTPIGEGANHLVYWYEEPGKTKRVIKIGKAKSLTTISEGAEELKQNFEISKKYFPNYVVDTDVIADPEDNQFYCVVQDGVEGRSITNKHVKNHPEIRKQLAEIVEQNNSLYKDEKKSLDFVGMPGFTAWFKRQSMKLLLRKSEFEVSNILVDKNNRLKIVDYEYFNVADDIELTKRLRASVGLFVNRLFMKHYFDLDIKR